MSEICKICGEHKKRLGNHIRSIHHISLKEYYDKYLKKEGEDICPICKKKKKFGRDLNEGYSLYCSRRCAMKSENVIEKRKIASLEKYGVDHPIKSNIIKNKIKKILKKKYNVTCTLRIPWVIEKSKCSNIQKYGYENAASSLEVKNKIRKTLHTKYGGHHLRLKEFQDKQRITVNEHYGVDNISQSHEIQEKKKQTCLERYGYEHYSKTKKFRKNAKQSIIKRYGDGNIIVPMIGYNEPEFFKKLQLYTNYIITRPTKPLFGCYPDGYIEELSLVIEFDEPHHNSPASKRNDNLKDEIYLDHNLKIFRVKQDIWDSNPEIVIKEFQSFL